MDGWMKLEVSTPPEKFQVNFHHSFKRRFSEKHRTNNICATKKNFNGIFNFEAEEPRTM